VNIEEGFQRAELAQQMSLAPGGSSYLLNVWLYSQFQTGGPQDYKQYGSQYVDFGNFNYGAVCGAAGMSLEYCQSAAGLGLIGRVALNNDLYAFHLGRHYTYNGSGIPFISWPYGDQAPDSQEIANGYAYQNWKKVCRGVN
jgi:putative RNase toxin 44 of polymorphic toxin system